MRIFKSHDRFVLQWHSHKEIFTVPFCFQSLKCDLPRSVRSHKIGDYIQSTAPHHKKQCRAPHTQYLGGAERGHICTDSQRMKYIQKCIFAHTRICNLLYLKEGYNFYHISSLLILVLLLISTPFAWQQTSGDAKINPSCVNSEKNHFWKKK